MKKSVLVVVLFILIAIRGVLTFGNSVSPSNNGDYYPILEDGKEWLTWNRHISIDPDLKPDTSFLHWRVVGDSILDSQRYKTISFSYTWSSDDISSDCIFLLREDEGILYWYNNYTETEQPIINMTLNKSDSIQSGISVSTNEYWTHTVLNTDFIEVNGCVRKRIETDLNYFSNQRSFWVEGVGCNNKGWMLDTGMATNGRNYFELIECRLNGETIFTFDDFYTPGLAAIPATNISDGGDTAPITIEGNRLTLAPEAAEATVHNAAGQLVGRLLPGQSLILPRGIYILRSANKITKVAL